MQIVVTPQFNATTLYNETIGRDWTIFQFRANLIGNSVLVYMRNYIDSHRHRSPKRSGASLVHNIRIHHVDSPATVGWGIGDISYLQRHNPYWYVLNYGKTISGQRFIPGMGKMVPGSFDPTGAPKSQKRNFGEPFIYSRGGDYAMLPKQAIRPIPYIHAGNRRMRSEINKLLASLSLFHF